MNQEYQDKHFFDPAQEALLWYLLPQVEGCIDSSKPQDESKLYHEITLLKLKATLILVNPKTRVILPSMAVHWQEVKSGEGMMVESSQGPQDVSSPLFLSCWYQLNIFASLSELMLNLLAASLAHNVPMLLKNIPEKDNTTVCPWTSRFYHLIENLWHFSSISKIALGYLEELAFTEYCASWL